MPAVISCLKIYLNFLPGGKQPWRSVIEVYIHMHSQPLELKGSCMLKVTTVPQTDMSAIAEFYVVLSHAATLGRKMSEMLEILKIGINVNNCSTILENAQPADKKASLRARFPKVFEGLGKLKGYQLKLHQADSISPVAQPLREIPFSRRQKVTEKLKQLEKLDVMEKSMAHHLDQPTCGCGEAQQ